MNSLDQLSPQAQGVACKMLAEVYTYDATPLLIELCDFCDKMGLNKDKIRVEGVEFYCDLDESDFTIDVLEGGMVAREYSKGLREGYSRLRSFKLALDSLAFVMIQQELEFYSFDNMIRLASDRKIKFSDDGSFYDYA